MDFATREADESDLDQCLAIVTDRFLYDAEHLAALRGMWSDIIGSQCGIATVVTDATDPSDIIHFAAAVFVDDEAADRHHSCVNPRIAFCMVEDWCAGRRCFLPKGEIARMNAGSGLNLVVIHYGYVEPPDEESREKLRFAANENAVRSLRGWNLRTYTNQVFDPNPERDAKAMGEALGFRVSRYTAEQLHEAGISINKMPYLWTARRQDVAAGPVGLALGMLFRSFSPPHFQFTDAEQDLLRLALEGHTDVTITTRMNASLTTTKKRFRTIYEKVRVESASWETPLLSELLVEGSRGVEARRHLLSYLRNHPEELRPYRGERGES